LKDPEFSTTDKMSEVEGGKASGVSRGTTAPSATVQSFAEDMTQKTGMAPRTIRESVRAKRIKPFMAHKVEGGYYDVIRRKAL